MELLKDKIKSDGVAVGTEILKVDSFLNHQIDVEFLEKIGKEFADRFKDVAAEGVDKIVTVEASGIAVACFASKFFGYPPVVFAKKEQPNTMNEENYFTEVYSFTKSKVSSIRIAKKFLDKGDKVIVIDDFLAHGQAAAGLAHLIDQAEAELLGIGIVIEKEFQGGGKKLEEKGIRLESLAVVEKIEDGKITFR